jgi:DNA-binding transcriptional LysR family regulator
MGRDAVKWDDLRVFLEVARQGSVHAAAKRLNLDHSTVCRRVGKLESLLSIKLLDRTQRGIVLRDGVQDVLRHIEHMETHANSLEDAIAGTRTTAAQIVRIATMEGIASRYLARRIPLLERFAPSVKIELVSIPQPVDLSRKEADIFLSFFDPRLPGLASKKIAEFSLFLYCSDAYMRAHGCPRSREDLANHVFVDYIEDLLEIDAVRWLNDVVRSPTVSFYSNSIIAQCGAAVVAGLTRVLPDEASVRRDVWVSVRVEQSTLRRIKSVMQFLTHIFQMDRAFLMGSVADLS